MSPLMMRAAQLGLTAIILTVLWRSAGGDDIAATLRTAEIAWLVAAALALTAQTLLSALRWRITAAPLGLTMSARYAVREYYLSQLVNQTVPGGVLGDAARAMRSRDEGGLLVSGQAVVFERLLGQIVMFAVMIIAVTLTFTIEEGLDWPARIARPLLFTFAVMTLVCLAIWLVPNHHFNTITRWRAAFASSITARDVLPRQILLSIATTICNLAAFAFCAHAVGLPLGIVETAALVPVILFTMLIPLTVSGWGLREGAAVALLPLAGASTSIAFAASVVFGLMILLSSLPGLAVLWSGRKRA